MPVTRSGGVKNLELYKQMLEDSSTRLDQMEAHLRELVNIMRLSEARQYEDEHRVVQSHGDAAGTTYWDVPQGETWVCERIAVGTGQATTQLYIYRDLIADVRLVEVDTTDAAGRYGNGLSRNVWLPPRSRLIVNIATANIVTGNLQVRVLKRYLNRISAEEAYALTEDFSEYEQEERELRGGMGAEPHDERHGDNLDHEGPFDDQDGFGGDIEPPGPFEDASLRPTPHFGSQILDEAMSGIERAALHLKP